MGRKMYFKALLPVESDIATIWHQISGYNRVNLGGEDSKYTVYFTGSIEDGLAVLKYLSGTADCEVQLTIGY